MRSTMRKARFASLSLAVLLGTAVAGQVKDADLLKPDPNDFLLYSGTLRFAAAFAAEADQHRRTSARLQAKWIFHLTGAKDLEAPPIVYKGVMYVGQYNRVHALDAATGRLIWEYFRQPRERRMAARHRHLRRHGLHGRAGFRARRARSPHRQPACGKRARRRQGKRFQGPMPFAAKGLIIMSGSGQGGGFIEAFDAQDRRIEMVVERDSEAGRAGQRNMGRRLVAERRQPDLGERQLRSARSTSSTGAPDSRRPISSATTARATTSTPTASSRSTSTPAR